MNVKELSPELKAELEALAAMPDHEIDTTAIPEVSDESWAFSTRPGLRRPGQEVMRLCLDEDVVAWLKRTARPGDYQAAINRALREHLAAT